METKGKRLWDINFFLILIPFINVINYYLTYKHITLSWYTVITFCLDTIEGYAAWLLTRYIITFLDKKIPFEVALFKRIIIQTFTTLLAGVLLIVLLTELANVIATNKPVPNEFYRYDIFIIAIWFFVINGIYISVHFYHEWQHSKQVKDDKDINREKLSELFENGFSIKNGKTDLILPYKEIAGFYMDGEYVTCSTILDKKYLIDQSLDKIENELPAILFFRLNRQFLIHRQIINGFQRVENGKLSVLIKPFKNITSPILVSRTKAAAFKKWFQKEFKNTST